MTQTVHLFKCFLSLGAFLKPLEAFPKIISVEIIFATPHEGTKYGFTDVENCQECVPVRLRICTKINKNLFFCRIRSLTGTCSWQFSTLVRPYLVPSGHAANIISTEIIFRNASKSFKNTPKEIKHLNKCTVCVTNFNKF